MIGAKARKHSSHGSTMRLIICHLVITALLLPIGQARRAAVPSSIRSLVSADAIVAKKRRFQFPRLKRAADNAESSDAKKEANNAVADSDAKKDEAVDAGSNEDARDGTSESGDSNDANSRQENNNNAGNTESQDKESSQEQPPDSQSNNSTRPSIVFMPPAHQHQMHPAPHPYYMPQQQRRHHSKKPSLLSSILMPFLPKPSPFPPNPYNNPQPQNEVTTTLFSLLLRLTLLSLSTHILDLFGHNNDAFLPSPAQHYTFERVNDRYRRDGNALSLALKSPPPGVGKYKWKQVFKRRRRSIADSLQQNHDNTHMPTLQNGGLYNKTVIILDIKPDSRVGNGMAEHLRDTISFIIEQHRNHMDRRLPSPHPNNLRSSLPHLEVLLLLDSPGGTVSDYGLASSQLTRLRNEPNITLSICIDRIAASGGYMMACQATPGHLMAAPFAMVGSIGVLMETINVYDVLKNMGVKPLTIKAGRHKAPLKALGEVTDEEMGYAQRDAEAIHEAFIKHVVNGRCTSDNVVRDEGWMEKVCTGSVFLGGEAKELGLIDRVLTSDEYVAERIEAGDRVLRLLPYRGPQFGFRLSPMDLLLGMDGGAEGRVRIGKVLNKVKGIVASICRVGGAVGVLNAAHHLASLALQSNVCWTIR